MSALAGTKADNKKIKKVTFFESDELLWLLDRRWQPAKTLINVPHYSKTIKGINTKLGILAHHVKVQLPDKGDNSKRYSFGVMLLVKKN